ncbi:hypothetical protein ACFLZL_05375, partial [Thermodesulfobacteriota bacterium]
PRSDTASLLKQLGQPDNYSDYTKANDRQQQAHRNDGIFIAGTAQTPMGISETIRHATLAAHQAAKYLER